MNRDVDWGAYVQSAHSRHTTRYLAYAAAHSETSKVDFDALETERLNILTGMDCAYQERQWEFVLRFMSALEQYLHLQGHWGEAATCAGYALDAAAHLQDEKARAQWTFYDGLVQAEQGNYEDAEPRYWESLDLAQAEGKITIQAECWRRLGWLAHVRGERDTAKANYQQAIAFHRQADDRLGQARDWRQLAILAIEDGEFDMAQEHLQTSLALVKGCTDWQTQQLRAGVWLDLGRIALRRGHLKEARQHLEQALTHVGKAPDRLLQADIHFHLGMLAEEQGNLEEAAEQYQERLNLARSVVDRRGEVSALIALGNLLLRQGEESNYDQVQRYYEQALELGDRHNRAVATAQLGTLAYLQGNYQQAMVRLAEALNTFQELDHQKEAADCYQQLGLVAQSRQQWQIAQKCYQASLDIGLKLGLCHKAVQSLYQLGTLTQQLGQYEVARQYYMQALYKGEKAGFPNLGQIRQALANLSR